MTSLKELVKNRMKEREVEEPEIPIVDEPKKKEVKELKASEILGGATARIKVTKMEPPTQRKAGEILPDVATLVDKLRNEAKII